MALNLNNGVFNAFKVSDEIMNRLFNHKPFIFGEIRFIFKEFEEIRNESDLNQMFDTLRRLTDFKETKMDFAIDSCHEFNDKLDGCVDSVNNLMQEILGLESEQQMQRNSVLKSKREERNQKIIDLSEATNEKINQIDSQFEEQENNLKTYYKELETKLKINQN